MTIRVLADTHALLWYLENDPRLSPAVDTLLATTEAAGDQIAISSITLAEVTYLSEKGRLPSNPLNRILAALDHQPTTLVEIPVDRAVVSAMVRIPRAEVPDLPDRLIAATALMLGVPVVSRDRADAWRAGGQPRPQDPLLARAVDMVTEALACASW
jgi:PIN domain nuclease of toxin-antitoxin system